jgi:hypothetical protein
MAMKGLGPRLDTVLFVSSASPDGSCQRTGLLMGCKAHTHRKGQRALVFLATTISLTANMYHGLLQARYCTKYFSVASSYSQQTHKQDTVTSVTL